MVTPGSHWTLLYLKPWTNKCVFLMEMFAFSSVESLSSVWLFTNTRLPSPSPSARACSNSCPWSWWCIQPPHPPSSPSPPAFNLSQHQDLFQWVRSLHQVAKVFEFQIQHQSFQWIFMTDFLEDWLVRSPCSPRNSQESSPTPDFKSISSLVLTFLHGETLTSICNYWKNHNFD